MRQRRKMRTSFYRGKKNAYAYGHFMLRKRIHLIRNGKFTEKKTARVKGLVTRLHYKGKKKAYKRQRYFPRNLVYKS